MDGPHGAATGDDRRSTTNPLVATLSPTLAQGMLARRPGRLQRQVEAPTLGDVDEGGAAASNPLVGLKKGDGLNVGTWDLRPRVKLLQHRLNEQTGAGLTTDGMWGKLTSAALEQFCLSRNMVPLDHVDRATGDALMATGEPKVEPPDKPPGPVDVGSLFFNSALEATFDRIVEQYGALLARQGETLNQFRQELGEPEKPQPGLLGTLIIEGANFVIDRTLGSAETSLRGVAQAAARGALDALPSATPDKAKEKVVEAAVTAPFTAAVDTGKSVVKEAVSPATSSASIADFVAAQHRGQISSHRDAVASFQQSKPDLRQFTEEDLAQLGGQPIPGMVDPRLDRAEAVLKGVTRAVEKAPTKTYREVAASWATVNARRGLREHGSFRTDVTEVGQLQDAATGSVLGVLEVTITFNPNQPKEKVRVTELRIAGLSPTVREKLTAGAGGKPPTVGQLGFPVRIQGSEGGGLFGIGSTDIAVAAPEDRREPEKVNKGDDSAHPYYQAKGDDGSGGPPGLLQLRGMARVVAEVDAVVVKDVGLQGP